MQLPEEFSMNLDDPNKMVLNSCTQAPRAFLDVHSEHKNLNCPRKIFLNSCTYGSRVYLTSEFDNLLGESTNS